MMHFELTKEFVDRLQQLIEQKSEKEIQQLLDDLHAADIAEIMDSLTMEEAKSIYLLLEGEKASDVLLEIPEPERKKFLRELPPEIIARQFIEFMDSDDAVDIVQDLDEDLQQEVLNEIADIEHAGDIVDLLEYDEESAGGIMAKELVSVNENWTVATCLKEISNQAENVDEIYYVYVVDDTGILKGILSLKKLIQNNTNAKISNLYNADIKSVTTEAHQEEVARIIDKYDLVALPVVDSIGRLKGRITVDDVIDVIKEEAEKDYQMVSGITGDVEMSDKVWRLTRARVPWLMIGLMGGIVGSQILGLYTSALTQFRGVALFIPLIAAMGGNVGVQSSSIVVQTLASGSRNIQSTSKKILKEVSVALITALIFSTLIFAYNFFVNHNLDLTYSVSASLFIVIIFASLFGTVVPLVLNRFKIDPAVATGPFITTSNDILGLFVYMHISTFFYNIF
ncbi:MAG: magnesium transporter [Prolixibacteraceae bacterium]|nr:magnesium transporter [Prolixibacteraceae bacterium]MBN2773831.1 magnesium transporter [Prolixibacteraceae bacterium]